MIIKNICKKLPWDEFISQMVENGFIIIKSLNFKRMNEDSKSGFLMIIDNPVISGTYRDSSHLFIKPYAILKPVTINQVKKIVMIAQKLKIPITVSGGKTGLSAGYANYGILLDLNELKSLGVPYKIYLNDCVIEVEQSTLVSDLIKWVLLVSNNQLIFPVQPSSAWKLPVMIGGLIASNASGVTSGKLGPIFDWIVSMRVLFPSGDISEVKPDNPIYKNIVGGNGYFGIILSAKIRLYHPSENPHYCILYGDKLNSAFNGLQIIQEKSIFPLTSEFVFSDNYLPGIFSTLNINTHNNLNSKPNWAIILKGTVDELEEFRKIMSENTHLSYKQLTEEKYKEYIAERTSIAVQSISDKLDLDFLTFPGFEDVLCQPKDIPDVLKCINDILNGYGFQTVSIGYGHINFRKGLGTLMHVRLPVPINYFYEDRINNRKKIISTITNVIFALNNNFNIKPKAEHSFGAFGIWFDDIHRKKISDAISSGTAFYNSHLEIYKEIKKLNPDDEKEVFIDCLNLYL